MSDAHTLDKSHNTYPDTVLQGRSLLLLDRSIVRRVSQTAISIESKGLDAASRSLSHNLDRAFSGYKHSLAHRASIVCVKTMMPELRKLPKH